MPRGRPRWSPMLHAFPDESNDENDNARPDDRLEKRRHTDRTIGSPRRETQHRDHQQGQNDHDDPKQDPVAGHTVSLPFLLLQRQRASLGSRRPAALASTAPSRGPTPLL